MNANIDKRTTARTFLVGKPQANSSGNSARPDPAGTRAINFAQAPFGDDVPGGANSGGKPKLASKKINQSAFFRFIAQHLHFRSVHRRWFLAKDVLTGFQRGQGRREMQKVRQTNYGGVQIAIA